MCLDRKFLQFDAANNYRDNILRIIPIFILCYYLFFPASAICEITYYAPNGTIVTKEEFEIISNKFKDKSSTKQEMANTLKAVEDDITKNKQNKKTNDIPERNSIHDSLRRMSKEYESTAKFLRKMEIESEIEANRRRDEQLNKQNAKMQEKHDSSGLDLRQNKAIDPDRGKEIIVKQETAPVLRNKESDKVEAAARNSGVIASQRIEQIKKENEAKRQEYEKKQKEVEQYNAQVEEYNNAQQNKDVKSQSFFGKPKQDRVKYEGRHPYLGKDDPNKPYYQRHPAAR